MTDPTPTTPLWRVMHKAFIDYEAANDDYFQNYHGYAAELRAVRDYLHNNTALSLDVLELLSQEIARAEAGQ